MEELLDFFDDFLGDAIDSIADAIGFVCEKVSEWASNIWNWLSNFFYQVWDSVSNWLDEIANWAEEKLKHVKGLLISRTEDPRIPVDGEKLKKIIDEVILNKGKLTPNDLRKLSQNQKALENSDYKVFCVDEKCNIKEINALKANVVQNPYQINKLLDEKGGLLYLEN